MLKSKSLKSQQVKSFYQSSSKSRLLFSVEYFLSQGIDCESHSELSWRFYLWYLTLRETPFNSKIINKCCVRHTFKYLPLIHRCSWAYPPNPKWEDMESSHLNNFVRENAFLPTTCFLSTTSDLRGSVVGHLLIFPAQSSNWSSLNIKIVIIYLITGYFID